MAQNVNFSETGLNLISIGQKVSDVTDLQYKPIKEKISNALILCAPERIYQFYFVKFDTLTLEGSIPVVDLYFAADQSGVIKSIFLFVESINEKIHSRIDLSFGKEKLNSRSSINGFATHKTSFWKFNDIKIFVTDYGKSRPVKMEIGDSNITNNEPSIIIADF